MHRQALEKHGWSAVCGLLLSLSSGLPAHAAPANPPAQVAIGSPLPNALVGGRITLSLAYGSGGAQITAFTVLVDDAIQFSRPFAGLGNGIHYVDLDTRTIPDGNHVIKIVANGLRGQIAFDQVKITVKNGVAGGPDVVPPLVQFRGLTDGQEVRGFVDVDLLAEDNVTTKLLVSIFVNQNVKLIRNVPPYLLRLDTSKFLDPKTGRGTIQLEAWAFDDAKNRGMARPITLKVVPAEGDHTPIKSDPAATRVAAGGNVAEPMGPKPLIIPLRANGELAPPMPQGTHPASGEPSTRQDIHAPYGGARPTGPVMAKANGIKPIDPDVSAAPSESRGQSGVSATGTRYSTPSSYKAAYGKPKPLAPSKLQGPAPIAAAASDAAASTSVRTTAPGSAAGPSTNGKPAAAHSAQALRTPGSLNSSDSGTPHFIEKSRQPGAPARPLVAKPLPGKTAPVAAATKPVAVAPAAKPVAPAPAPKPAVRMAEVPKTVLQPEPPMEVRSGEMLVIPMQALPIPMPSAVREATPAEARATVPTPKRAAVKAQPAPGKRMAAGPSASLAQPKRSDAQLQFTVKPGTRANSEGRIVLDTWIVDPTKMPKEPTYRVQRGDTVNTLARKFHVTPKSILLANAKLGPSDLHRGEVVRIPNTFDVMMNNERVAFDVNPRIDNGVPMAPFRQIFEHAGGVVLYDPTNHEVNASGDNQQVKIRIGTRDAWVNQSIVVLDRAAFIDSGRTIVPMSFMQKAMGLRAEYDVKTKTIILVHR